MPDFDAHAALIQSLRNRLDTVDTTIFKAVKHRGWDEDGPACIDATKELEARVVALEATIFPDLARKLAALDSTIGIADRLEFNPLDARTPKKDE